MVCIVNESGKQSDTINEKQVKLNEFMIAFEKKNPL